MKKYKALMLDLDGTTIPSRIDGMPSEKVKQAVAKASDLLHVGIATARSLNNTRHISNKLQLSGPSIISGGGQIIDFPSQKILIEEIIDLNAFKQVSRILNKIKIAPIIQDGEEEIIFSKDYVPNKPYGIFFFDRNQAEIDRLMDMFSNIPKTVIHKIPSWVDGEIGFVISNPLATKQHGIFEVAKILGIDTHEIIGVGDGYNDFPLLMACGLKIAMGNAVPELKEIADFIAPTVEEDGVAWVIEKFVLGKDAT